MTFSYSVVISDSQNLGGSLDTLMMTDLQAALADWSNYITGLGTLVVNLVVSPTLRANGGPTSVFSNGITASGASLAEPSSIYELTTGQHAPGTTSDITINIDPSYANMLFLNPSPNNGAAVPSSEIDAISVFRHEVAHGLGFIGYYDSAGNNPYGNGPGGFLTSFDTLIQQNADGTADFIGTVAESVFGGPVPLTTNTAAENYYHLANAVTDPNGQDLMNGQAFYYGTSYQISKLDRAILQDLGNPIAITTTSPSVVTLHGTHQQYVISPQQDGTLLVQDQVAGRDGTIHTNRFSAFAFADGQGIGDTTGAAEDIDRIYQAAFNRPADLAGVQYWADAVHAGHLTIGGVAEAFTQSPEFIGGNGTLNTSDYVQALYQNVFGRAGEANGVTYWMNMLASGTDRGQVLVNFADSTESLARTLIVDGDLNAAEIARLYRAAFNRNPDTSGAQFWTAALSGGATPLSVAQGFAASPEFATAYGGLGELAYVGRLYANILNRAGDLAGIQFWENQLAGGATPAQVLLGFADSNENRIGTSAMTHDGWAFLG